MPVGDEGPKGDTGSPGPIGAQGAVIIDGATQFKVISNANQLLSELDEITIKITTPGGAISNGASVSLSTTII